VLPRKASRKAIGIERDCQAVHLVMNAMVHIGRNASCLLAHQQQLVVVNGNGEHFPTTLECELLGATVMVDATKSLKCLVKSPSNGGPFIAMCYKSTPELYQNSINGNVIELHGVFVFLVNEIVTVITRVNSSSTLKKDRMETERHQLEESSNHDSVE
jgi:hypothetical protein